MILQCAEDSIVPLKTGQYLHESLYNSTFKVMDAKGHYPHLSHPIETIKHIQDYLSLSQP